MPSLITSIIGGIQGASAAHNAATEQANSANQAGATVTGAANTVNPTLIAAGNAAGAGVTAAANAGSTAVTGAANTAGTGVVNAAQQAGTGMTSAVGDANGLLNPYATTGNTATTQMNDLLQSGDLTKPFTAQMMEQNDPGYQFRINQANKAYQASAAARGGAQGGGALKALASLSQNMASSEYGNAFNRYQSGQLQRYSMLADQSRMGMAAAGQMGTNDISGARYVGDMNTSAAQYAGNAGMNAATWGANAGLRAGEYAGDAGMRQADLAGQNTMNAATYTGNTQMAAGNARAQGDMGAAKAWNGMLGGIGSFGNDVLTGGFSGMLGGFSNMFRPKVTGSNPADPNSAINAGEMSYFG